MVLSAAVISMTDYCTFLRLLQNIDITITTLHLKAFRAAFLLTLLEYLTMYISAFTVNTKAVVN